MRTDRSPAQKRAWKNLNPKVRWAIRNSPWKRVATKCRREFSYECSNCSSKKKLEAHHIYPRHEYKKLELDLDNTCLVCAICHDELHRLLLSDPDSYYKLVSELVKKRVKIKRLKDRNPSGLIYDEYKPLVPEIIASLGKKPLVEKKVSKKDKDLSVKKGRGRPKKSSSS